MASLGPALLLLLIGSLVPFGGIPDEGAPGSPVAPTVQTSAQAGQLSAQAPGTATASVDAGRLEVSVASEAAAVETSPSALRARVAGTQVHVAATLGDLFSTELPVSVEVVDGSGPQAGRTATPTSQVTPQPSWTPTTEAPTGVSEAVGLQAAAAAALAAVAVSQSDPGLTSLRRWLRFAPLAGLYSRISRSEVLDHETREAIYDLLTAEPGLSLGSIAERLDLSRSTARHHVHKLEEADLIRHRVEGRCRIHYPVGHEAEAVAEHALRNESRARIAELLEVRPLSLMELSGLLDANPGAVHFHLGKLQEAGLVERYENGSVKYRLR